MVYYLIVVKIACFYFYMSHVEKNTKISQVDMCADLRKITNKFTTTLPSFHLPDNRKLEHIKIKFWEFTKISINCLGGARTFCRRWNNKVNEPIVIPKVNIFCKHWPNFTWNVEYIRNVILLWNFFWILLIEFSERCQKFYCEY